NQKQLIELYDKFIDGKSEIRGEWEVQDKFGDRKIILADAIRIKGEDNNYKKVTFIIDITERKRLEEKLKKANQELKEKANTDGLTGLYNHKEIIRRLNLELKRANRYELNLAILMLDIDDFKAINDSYGHQKGDEVLKTLAQLLENITRKEDIIGRYGGEEFLVVFPHTASDDALDVAQRICQGIADQGLSGVDITISGGLAIFNNQSAEELIKEADTALYQAKSNGKNQIVNADNS
ncbi:MAG: diguanylate cyclase, partial [Bacillota bacterium]